ncbi:MAG: hypothetical protein AAF417_04765 [Pseudomonadota bacterium]
MKISIVLIGLVLCGCVNQPPESSPDSPPEVIDVDVFYEEPTIDYEVLDRVDTTRRSDNQMDVLVEVLRRAEKLGADGVIVHTIYNRGRVSGSDAFGTGGGGGFAVYQIRATAIKYVE